MVKWRSLPSHVTSLLPGSWACQWLGSQRNVQESISWEWKWNMISRKDKRLLRWTLNRVFHRRVDIFNCFRFTWIWITLIFQFNTKQWMTFKIVQLHKECPISTEYSDKATNTAQIFSPKINYSDIFSGQKGRLWYIWSLWCGKCLKTKMSLWFVMEIIGKFKEDLTFEENEEAKVCWRGESGIRMRGKRDKRGRS